MIWFNFGPIADEIEIFHYLFADQLYIIMEVHTVTHTPTNKHMHPSRLCTLISPIMKHVLRYAAQRCVSDAALLKHRVGSRRTAVWCARVKWTGSESFGIFFQWPLCSSLVPICQKQRRNLTLPRCLLSVSFPPVALYQNTKWVVLPFVRSNQAWPALSTHCIMSLLWSDSL